jgi:hypothetical protein
MNKTEIPLLTAHPFLLDGPQTLIPPCDTRRLPWREGLRARDRRMTSHGRWPAYDRPAAA